LKLDVVSRWSRGKFNMAPDSVAASRWREFAAEARAVAADFTDPEAQRVMLLIAEGYDRLAEHADRRDSPENPK